MNQKETCTASVAEQIKKNNKGLGIILGMLGGILVLVMVALIAVTVMQSRDDGELELPASYFSPTYQGNIMEYGAYLDKNRNVTYCEDPSGYGMTLSMTEEYKKDFTPEAWFVYDYLQVLIAGDADAYNALFNEKYYKKNDPKAPFSPQMIYGAEIRYHSTANQGEDRLVTFILEYRIFENDGSFRRDIGSDSVRPQNMTLRVTSDGRISIEKLETVYSA